MMTKLAKFYFSFMIPTLKNVCIIVCCYVIYTHKVIIYR